MTTELPVLRLALAGFSPDQQRLVERALERAAGDAILWEVAPFEACDAVWVDGGRTQVIGSDYIRVVPGSPNCRAVQMHTAEVDRPIAFAQPVPPGFQPLCSFDLAVPASMARVLRRFEAWLSHLVAQFCLASHIAEHQAALGVGTFELRLGARVLAVVDMQGDAAVMPTAGPADFEGAMWRRSAGGPLPEQFARASLSQLMWQYAIRTRRDVLPPHYRTGLLYFRRAPRLPQKLVKDSHLLVMRELMLAPASFNDLLHRCGMAEARLARDLGALYFVGSITSNPKRAARPDPVTNFSSGIDSDPHTMAPRRMPARADLTAPAPLRPDH